MKQNSLSVLISMKGEKNCIQKYKTQFLILIRVWRQLKRPRNIPACVLYQSQVFKQNVSTSTSSKEIQIYDFLFVQTLTSLFSFLSARLIGLFLRSPWPKNERFNEKIQTDCFVKYEKNVFQPSPPLPPHLSPLHTSPSTPNFSISSILPPTSNYYHLSLPSHPPSPHFKNFIWILNPRSLLDPLQFERERGVMVQQTISTVFVLHNFFSMRISQKQLPRGVPHKRRSSQPRGVLQISCC